MNKLHWFKHLFWMLGNMYLNFLKGDIKNAIDSYYWIRIHVTYKSKLVKYTKSPFWQRMKMNTIVIFGILFTVFLLCMISLFIHTIIIFNQ
ncbi:hypothetical protein ES703_34562 [subsurface metagenome]